MAPNEQNQEEPVSRFTVIMHQLPEGFENGERFTLSFNDYKIAKNKIPTFIPSPGIDFAVCGDKVYAKDFKFLEYIKVTIVEHTFFVAKENAIISVHQVKNIAYFDHGTIVFKNEIYNIFEVLTPPKKVKKNIVMPGTFNPSADTRQMRGN